VTAFKVHTAVPLLVMGLAAMTVSIGVVAWKAGGPPILINETPSEPKGFYRLVKHPQSDYRLTMYVVFPVPPELRSLVYGRHWMKEGIPLLKEILGLAGDQVCVFTDRLEINGQFVGPVFQRDSVGLPLPQHPGCFEVQPGTFFAASQYLDKSFDGRYFGPLPLAQLQGEALPLWTF
jgi:conjugative transfer signal peptidase TraF